MHRFILMLLYRTVGTGDFSKCKPRTHGRISASNRCGRHWLDPDGASITWAEDPDLRAYILSKCTPHPKGTFAKGVTLSGRQNEVPHKHYIIAAKNAQSPFQREYQRLKTRADWTHDTLNTGMMAC